MQPFYPSNIIIEVIEEKLKEVYIMKELQHPNIVKYIYHSYRMDEICLYMEKMDGDLQDLIKMRAKDKAGKRYYDWEEVWSIVSSVANALLYLHESKPPVVHLDIKVCLFPSLTFDKFKHLFIIKMVRRRTFSQNLIQIMEKK